jgi:hypothetical protein
MATLSDPAQTMSFQLSVGPVKDFPNYETVFKTESFADLTEEGDAKSKREWEPVGFNSQHLKHCGEIAKILETAIPKDQRKNGMVVRVFDSGAQHAPRVFDFIGYPGAVLLTASVELTQTALPLATARILAPAVKGTVAALRAHATRWRDAAAAATNEAEKADALARAEGFDQRVAEVMARTSDLPAVEGPKEAPATPALPDPEEASDEAPPAARPVHKGRRRAAEVVH